LPAKAAAVKTLAQQQQALLSDSDDDGDVAVAVQKQRTKSPRGAPTKQQQKLSTSEPTPILAPHVTATHSVLAHTMSAAVGVLDDLMDGSSSLSSTLLLPSCEGMRPLHAIVTISPPPLPPERWAEPSSAVGIVSDDDASMADGEVTAFGPHVGQLTQSPLPEDGVVAVPSVQELLQRGAKGLSTGEWSILVQRVPEVTSVGRL